MALEFGKIEKLFIQAYSKPNFAEDSKIGAKHEALINPETYAFKYKIDFCETQAAGTSGVALKFNKIPPQEFNFDFLFDSTGVIKGASVLDIAPANPFAKTKTVADKIEEFKHYILEYNGETHRPNFLKIHWGTLLFKGILIALDIEFKLFKPDGTPIRAIARCSFKGTIEENLRVAKENRQSPDVTHERVFTASDKFSLLSGRMYKNQNYYTDVASINKLDGFRSIKPGTKIYFPPVK